jgi:hypothetical protein
LRANRDLFLSLGAASLSFAAVYSPAIFVAVHLAPMIGLTSPVSFVFDEAHDVPAARQMLELVMPQPMLNPMHPPLAKQLMALPIRAFGSRLGASRLVAVRKRTRESGSNKSRGGRNAASRLGTAPNRRSAGSADGHSAAGGVA